MKFLLLVLVGFVFALNFAQGQSGKKDFQETCSITDSLNPFNKDDSETCNSEKNLMCLTGKCGCTPIVSVYQESIFGAIGFGKFLGGCVGAAERPCINSNCVRNARCKGDRVAICLCNEGYQADSEGFCSSGSNFGPAIFAILLMALFAKILN